MQKLLFTFLLAAASVAVMAQTSAKKYLLIEHFTNTRCGICGSRNPGFFNTIDPYEADIHHISIHPSFPYSNCALYLGNPTDNSERATFYAIDGTPRLVFNGVKQAGANPLTTSAKIEQELNQTSPLYVKVTQTKNGNTLSAQIDAFSFGAIPAGNYRIFAIAVEKTLNYSSPNGETVHHNVLRDILSDKAGDPFTPASQGNKVTANYTVTMPSTWNTAEMYILAFVQNMDTKAILNSGTPFDPIVTGAEEVVAQSPLLKVSPNPANDQTTVALEGGQIESIAVFAANGQLVQQRNSILASRTELSLTTLAPGVYFLKVVGDKGVYTTKIVKQ